MSGDEQGTEAVNDERQGTARVVLRGVRAVALDGLSADEQRAVLAAAGKTDVVNLSLLWEPVALRYGTVEVAIQAYAGKSGKAGNRPGVFRAPPEGTWGVSPLVIEPPLG